MKSAANEDFFQSLSNLCLLIFKLIVGFMTGSIAILTEVIRSGMDLLVLFISFFRPLLLDQ